MAKIAICGKAGSGKDTVGKVIAKERYRSFSQKKSLSYKDKYTQTIALANPVKEIARIMFPNAPRKFFYGASKFRMSELPNAFKNGDPLTVRQLLIDIGTTLGRNYNENLWLDVFDKRVEKILKYYGNIIVTDVRFRNEFDHVKKNGFFMVRLKRQDFTKINDISETDQDGINDSEFDYILNNDGTKDDLENEVKNNLMPRIFV